MTIPAWPTNVPDRPIRGGLTTQQPYRPAAATEVEDGPEIFRVQSQTIITKFDYSILMTTDEYADFKTFAVDTLSQGTSRFTMTVGILGTGYVSDKLCYFEGAQWKSAPYGVLVMVSFTLCVFGGL